MPNGDVLRSGAGWFVPSTYPSVLNARLQVGGVPIFTLRTRNESRPSFSAFGPRLLRFGCRIRGFPMSGAQRGSRQAFFCVVCALPDRINVAPGTPWNIDRQPAMRARLAGGSGKSNRPNQV